MHTFHKKYSIAILLVFLFLLPAFSFAEGVGSFSRVEGRVDILNVGATSTVPAKTGDSVSMGDIIRTKSDGKVEITFRDETVIRIAPGSRLKIDEYTFNPDKTRDKGALSLLRGKVRAIVTKTKGGLIPVAMGTATFTIQTPTAIAGVRGSDVFVLHERRITGVLFREGHGFVYSRNMPDRIVDISPGQATFVMGPDVPPLPPRQAMEVEFLNHIRDTTLREVEAEGDIEKPAGEEMLMAGRETGFDFKPETETASESPEPVTENAPLTPPITETYPETLTDTRSPVISLTPSAVPEAGTELTTVNLNIASNEPSTFAYSLDGGTWTEGIPLPFIGLAEGSHTFDIQATDAAGNIASTSLPFDLSRYILSGTAVLTSSGVQDIGTATGEIAGVSNQNWGGYDITLSGSWWEGGSSTYTLLAGGTSTDTTITTNNYGYWLETITNAVDSGSTFSGTSNFLYLSYDRLGVGTGTVNGSNSSTWDTTYTGTYTETPLAFSGNIRNDQSGGGLYTFCDGLCVGGYTSGGLLGGTMPSLSNPTITYMGQYSTTAWPAPYMWTPVIYSGNASTTFAPSYDNNEFWGYIGGVWEEGAIDGKIYSLYIDQNGDAGILKGSLTGEYYSDILMYSASGQWSSPIKIATGVSQNDLTDLTFSPNNTWNGINSSSGTITGTDSITAWNADGRRDSIVNQPWGIWQTKVDGTFDLSIAAPFTATKWSLTTQSYDYSSFFPYPLEAITGTQTDGTLWTINSGETIGKLLGTTYGYGADTSGANPMTWISVGETIGTFDAVNYTWQAVQTGAWLEASKFLAMATAAKAGDSAAQAALTALNIPFAGVGKTTLSGTGSIGGSTGATVTMKDVTFFAYSNGAAPKIWATGDVQGTYTCTGCIGGGNIPISNGSNITADFNVQTFDNASTQTWTATVDNGNAAASSLSGYSGAVTFNGAAAGTIDTTSTFSGTGSGVAK